jgi:glycosyltransferase involved in cell wall biosynthesis
MHYIRAVADARAAGDGTDLAVVVTACNSMRTIERCIASVRPIATAVIVVDSGSTDGTIEACQRLGAQVVRHAWEGFARQKTFALSLASKHQWVLLLDSDESIEPDLQAGLLHAIQSARAETRAIAINRRLWFQGGWLRRVAFPDWVIRCGRQGALRIVDRPVHESVEADGPVVRAAGICRHDSWADSADAIERGIRYARLAAPFRRASALPILSFLGSAIAIFFKQGIVRGGIFDGRRGMIAIGLFIVGAYCNHMAALDHQQQARSDK